MRMMQTAGSTNLIARAAIQVQCLQTRDFIPSHYFRHNSCEYFASNNEVKQPLLVVTATVFFLSMSRLNAPRKQY